jgi:hypothetical protein
MRSFRDLKVWEKSHQLTLLAYDLKMLNLENYKKLEDLLPEIKKMLAAFKN